MKAKEKLEKEKNAFLQKQNKSLSPAMQQMMTNQIERFFDQIYEAAEVDPVFDEHLCNPEKTFEKCYEYMSGKALEFARTINTGKSGNSYCVSMGCPIDTSTMMEWMYDYYGLSADAEKKASADAEKALEDKTKEAKKACDALRDEEEKKKKAEAKKKNASKKSSDKQKKDGISFIPAVPETEEELQENGSMTEGTIPAVEEPEQKVSEPETEVPVTEQEAPAEEKQKADAVSGKIVEFVPKKKKQGSEIEGQFSLFDF